MVFSKTKPTDPISEAERQIADLSQQIGIAKVDLERAEAAATASALSGQGLDQAVSVAAQASAKLRALESALSTMNERVVELRRQRAEQESLEMRQAAKPRDGRNRRRA